MTEESKKPTNGARAEAFGTIQGEPASAGGAPKSHAPTSTFGDPVRPELGDEPGTEPRSTEPSKSDAKPDEDAGEGHKGPRVDATTTDRSSVEPAPESARTERGGDPA